METRASIFSDGRVTSLSFFNRGQVFDPRWQRRLATSKDDETAKQCGGHFSERRDVRWFSATQESGRSCATLVYTFLCNDASARTKREVELQRKAYLEAGPVAPIERDCGEKDSEKRRQAEMAKSNDR